MEDEAGGKVEPASSMQMDDGDGLHAADPAQRGALRYAERPCCCGPAFILALQAGLTREEFVLGAQGLLCRGQDVIVLSALWC